MNWFTKAASVVRDWLTVGDSPKVRDPKNSARASSAGIHVDDRRALAVSAFFSCLRLVASTIGSLPMPIYRKGDDGIAREARNSALWGRLNDRPNADQTPVDYWEFVAMSLLLRGHAYSRIVRDGKRIVSLDPVRPDIVSSRRLASGAKRYRWTIGGETHDVDETEMFHVTGFGGGLSIIDHARQTLGVAIAADEAAGSMFKNGVTPSGVLSFEKFLTEEQREHARGDMVDQFVGSGNNGRPFILEGGTSWTQISLKADDAQLLQSRAWSVEEVCRWFGVPPFMIGHNEKTTSWGTGIEQMTLGFQKFTLNPYLRRIEQAVRAQLLTAAERGDGQFAEFNLEGLLRGDSLGRARYYDIMTRAGIMSRNQARRKENWEPVEGGDEILVQAQYQPLAELVRQAIEEGQA